MDEDVSRPPGAAPAELPFLIVGLGASAGGLPALQQFFAAMPPDNGMAFVVIMHLAPDHDSHIAAILQRTTAMPVRQVTEAVRVVPETVYIIPPSRHLAMDEGMIVLADAERPDGRRVAIDLFFRTLADAHTTHAACIVLSGSGADGSVGITRARETGGITIAQDPHEAEYDGMPRNAISTGMIDFVLPVAAMPAQLLSVWRNAQRIALPTGGGAPLLDERQVAEEALHDVIAAVHANTGHDFRHYKRPTLLRRIERRMQVTTRPDLPAYRDYLQANPAEAALLLHDLLINVTNFFRDRAAFEALERAVIPLLFNDKTSGDTVRVWVAGCATGEEAYSLVILLLEHAARLPSPPAIQVFATDIDESALQIAREGSYSEAIAADVSPARLRQFFTQEPGNYCISAEVRSRVIFATHNLISDPPFSRLDLISCRNLLIYLHRAAQQHVFDLFHFALRPSGFLFLGGAEAPDTASNQFSPVDARQRLFRSSERALALRTVPAMPLQARGVRARPSRRAEREQIALSDSIQRVLVRHTPPSIVVNAAHKIVHLSEHAGHFVRPGDGALSFDALSMVRPELRSELRQALGLAFQTGQPAVTRLVAMAHEAGALSVKMYVYPEHDSASDEWLALVRFDAVTVAASLSAAGAAAVEPHAGEMAADLQRMQAQLEAAAVAHDTTVDALQASNQALLATNEELRVTTEELETNKEELQAVNEELRTVNQELNQRVDDLSAANDDLNNLMAATPIATVFLDRGLQIARYTPQARALFNLIHSDQGRPLAHITNRLDYPDLLAEAETVLRTALPLEREVAGDNERYYLARIAPYRSTAGRTDGVVLTFVDITERRHAEAELARAYVAEQAARIAAEAALQTRDQFLSIASHELRTPMTSLLGYAQLLPKALRRGTGDLTKMAEQIVRQAKQLNGLIDQLLDVSRLQRGQFAIERQLVDVAALSAQAAREFGDTLPPDLSHTLQIAITDNPALVMGDAARLEQVLQNLLSNAVKYSPRGGAIGVRVSRAAPNVLVEVSDQGIGVPPQVGDQLFMPFYRAPNADPQASGFGLGLYIAHEIVRRHGGRIEVASAEGAGSTFRVVLPLHEANEELALGAQAASL
jgi:two-component system CheB/CheR fusion protein